MTKMKPFEAQPVHKEFNQAMVGVFNDYKTRLSGEEMLALACHLVGVLIAHQDSRKYSQADIMEMVRQNMEAGNLQAISELLKPAAGHA